VRGTDGASGVAEDALTLLEGRRRGPPAARESASEELGRWWRVIEDGDRRHGAKSGGIEREVHSAIEIEHDIVRVLVLRHDVRWLPAPGGTWAPSQDIAKRSERLHLGMQQLNARRVQLCLVVHWDVTHGGFP